MKNIQELVELLKNNLRSYSDVRKFLGVDYTQYKDLEKLNILPRGYVAKLENNPVDCGITATTLMEKLTGNKPNMNIVFSYEEYSQIVNNLYNKPNKIYSTRAINKSNHTFLIIFDINNAAILQSNVALGDYSYDLSDWLKENGGIKVYNKNIMFSMLQEITQRPNTAKSLQSIDELFTIHKNKTPTEPVNISFYETYEVLSKIIF